MSFPVLQRMDRKRPEMIQPISWQAEAMKGLAQGLQTGMQLASTMNQIKLQQAANTRAEALHGMQTELMRQQIKALELENKTKSNQVNIQNMLTGGVINDNTAQLSLQQQGLVMDYTTGMTRLPSYNQHNKPDYIPKTFNEGLKSGYFVGPLMSEHHKASALALSNAPTADKIVALDNMYEKTAPFANDFYSAEQFSGVPMLAGLAQTLSPARYQLFMSDKVEATVKVTASNRAGMDEAIIAAAAQNAGTTTDALVASEKPIQVPFAKAIGGLRAGYFEGDFARMTAESSDPDKFLAYLGKMKVSPEIIARVKTQSDAMQGKTVVDGAGKTDLGASPLLGDQIYSPVAPSGESNTTQVTTNGVTLNVDERGIVDRVASFWSDNVTEPIARGINSRELYVAIRNEMPHPYSEGGQLRDAQKIADNYSYLRKQFDRVKREQEGYADMPGQEEQAKLMGKVADNLYGEITKMEKKYDMDKEFKYVGNIDLTTRPQVKMPDGTVATVKSMSFNEDGKEVVIPTVSDDGRIMEPSEAIANYRKTGKYLGKFKTVAEAEKYAKQLSKEEGKRISAPATAGAGNEVPAFSTVAQAEAANLPKGTIVLINGKRAIIE